MRLQLLTIICVLFNLLSSEAGIKQSMHADAGISASEYSRAIQSSTAPRLYDTSVSPFAQNPEHLLYSRVLSTQTSLYEECPYLNKPEQVKELYAAVHDASLEHDVDFELLLAMVVAESRCRNSARSHAGAMGLMQLMPDTARWLGVKQPYAVRDNVFGGGKYISYLLERYKGRLEIALAAYNAGPGTVERYRAVPPYRETRRYVARVSELYRRFSTLTKEHASVEGLRA